MRAERLVRRDVLRSFRKFLEGQEDIRRAHADGDGDRAWKAAVQMMRELRRSRRLVEELEKAETK